MCYDHLYITTKILKLLMKENISVLDELKIIEGFEVF